jgi:hypothetical protein
LMSLIADTKPVAIVAAGSMSVWSTLETILRQCFAAVKPKE